jgi:hypothetical protein
MVAITGLIVMPVIIFTAKQWQQVKSHTYQIKSIEEILKVAIIQRDTATSLMQKAAIDIAIVKEKVDNIESHIYNNWKPIHNKDGGYNNDKS